MRSTFLRLSLGLAVGLSGCGDDSNPAVDAGADAPKTPDAPVSTFKGFDADEGGEVRVEYIRFPDGKYSARATAFLFDNPGTTKYFPYINLNGCNDMTAKDKWPMATNPIAERTYLDPGQVIVSGGAQPLQIQRNPMMAADPFGRTHPANEWFFHNFNRMGEDGSTYLPEKTKLDVTFTGSDDMPAQIFDDVIYMPADFAVTEPGMVATVNIDASQDLTMTFTTPPDSPPPGYEVDSLIAITGPGGPAFLCVEPNDGSITIPAAMLQAAKTKFPTGGSLARQTLTHVVRELEDKDGPTGKRIDFIGVWCYAGTAVTWAP